MGESRGLREIDLEIEYRSDQGDLGPSLFEPCMSVAVRYDRAAGFFTSSVLVAAARGLERFIENLGRMRLVASPLLRTEDLEAIARGYEAREDVVQRAILRGIFDPEESLGTVISTALLCLRG